jgi:hypothetical protein
MRELDDMMHQVEEFDNARAVCDGTTPSAVLGAGDLLDDFVQTASRADDGFRGDEQEAGTGSGEGLPANPEDWEFESVMDSDDEVVSGSASAAPECAPA